MRQHESAIVIHMSPLSWTSLLPPTQSHPSRLSQSIRFELPASCSQFSLAILHICFNATLFLICPNLSFHHCVHKSVLYVCVFFSDLQIDSYTYVCVCVCIYIYIHIYICNLERWYWWIIYICIYVCVYVCVCVCVCVLIYRFFFSFWLTSFCIIGSRITLIRTDSNMFLFMTEWYSIAYMYCNFIHLSVDGHLDCFHVLAIVNSVTMNIGALLSF